VTVGFTVVEATYVGAFSRDRRMFGAAQFAMNLYTGQR